MEHQSTPCRTKTRQRKRRPLKTQRRKGHRNSRKNTEAKGERYFSYDDVITGANATIEQLIWNLKSNLCLAVKISLAIWMKRSFHEVVGQKPEGSEVRSKCIYKALINYFIWPDVAARRMLTVKKILGWGFEGEFKRQGSGQWKLRMLAGEGWNRKTAEHKLDSERNEDKENRWVHRRQTAQIRNL